MPYMNPLLESLLSEEPFLDTNNPEKMDEYADTVQDQYLLQGGKEKVKHPLSAVSEAVSNVMYESILTEAMLEPLLDLSDKQFLEDFSQESKTMMLQFSEAMVFGKSTTFLECEKLLDEAIEEVQAWQGDIIKAKQNTEKVAKLLEAHFNFGSLDINLRGFSLLIPAITREAKVRVLDKSIERNKQDTARYAAEIGYEMNPNDVERQNARYAEYRKNVVRQINKTEAINSVVNLANPNAFTLGKGFFSSVEHAISGEKALVASKDGVKWNNDIKPYAYIEVSMGLFTTRGMKGKHVLAIILHEIGHSFFRGTIFSRLARVGISLLSTGFNILLRLDSALSKIVVNTVSRSALMSSVYNAIYATLFNIVNIVMSALKLNVTEKIAKLFGAEAANVFHTVASTVKMYRTIETIFKFFSHLIFNRGILTLLADPTKILQLIAMDVLSEEKFADDFAAAHGYAPDLVEALNLLHGIVNTNRSGVSDGDDDMNNNITYVITYFTAIMQSMMAITDEHPAFISRPFYMADFYKSQLKKARSPREKKYIEKLLADTIKASSTYKVSDRAVKKDLVMKALHPEYKMATNINVSILDKLKDAISSDAGSMASLSTKLGY